MRTSDVCSALDGKTFPVKDGVPGVNMPPMHPWCRSTTIAVIDGAVTKDLKRRARDPETGELYEVPSDMTYEQWKAGLDDKHGEGYTDKRRKIARNEKSDRKQYEKYISVLGKENMPKTFDLFQDLKYNNNEIWNFVKLDYSRQTTLLKHPELALPNASKAIADDRKFTAYLFNPNNPK